MEACDAVRVEVDDARAGVAAQCGRVVREDRIARRLARARCIPDDGTRQRREERARLQPLDEEDLAEDPARRFSIVMSIRRRIADRVEAPLRLRLRRGREEGERLRQLSPVPSRRDPQERQVDARVCTTMTSVIGTLLGGFRSGSSAKLTLGSRPSKIPQRPSSRGSPKTRATWQFVMRTSAATRKPVPAYGTRVCPATSMRPTLSAAASILSRNRSSRSQGGGGSAKRPPANRIAGRAARCTIASRPTASSSSSRTSSPCSSIFSSARTPASKTLRGATVACDTSTSPATDSRLPVVTTSSRTGIPGPSFGMAWPTTASGSSRSRRRTASRSPRRRRAVATKSSWYLNAARRPRTERSAAWPRRPGPAASWPGPPRLQAD